MKSSFNSFALFFALLPSVFAHVHITGAVGANGVTTPGFGVDLTVPTNGTSEQPFQITTPVLKNLKDDPCGATLQAGSIKIADSLASAITAGGGNLPTLGADGTVTLEMHIVNADGGGPLTLMVNTDGTGKTWEAGTVVQNIPGSNGIVTGGPMDVTFIGKLPAGTTCTGGDTGDVCLVRVNNGGTGQTSSLANGAGPFGGCAAFKNAGATSESTITAAATPASSATAVAAAGRGSGRTTGRNRNANRNRGLGSVELRQARREIHMRSLLAKRQARTSRIALERRMLVARQKLTVGLINALKTATGTAVNIPIDAAAGQNDQADLGGNATTVAGAALTIEQATDLKAAVKIAIEGALDVLAAGGVSPDGFDVKNLSTDAEIQKADDDALAAFLDGSLTSVNQGNAGVADPNTAVVNSLVGAISDLRTITNGITLGLDGGGTTVVAALTTVAAATSVAATTTTGASTPAVTAATKGRNGGTRNRNRNRELKTRDERVLLSRVARGIKA